MYLVFIIFQEVDEGQRMPLQQSLMIEVVLVDHFHDGFPVAVVAVDHQLVHPHGANLQPHDDDHELLLVHSFQCGHHDVAMLMLFFLQHLVLVCLFFVLRLVEQFLFFLLLLVEQLLFAVVHLLSVGRIQLEIAFSSYP